MEKFSLWGRWLNLTFTWRIVSLREWSWVSDNGSQSLTFLFWKSVSNRGGGSKLYQQVNCRPSCSSSQSASQQSISLLLEPVSQSIVDLPVLDASQPTVVGGENSTNKSIVDLLPVSRHQLVSTIIISLFKRWNTALLKRRIEATHNNLTSNQQTTTQNPKQKNFGFPLRSAPAPVSLLQWNPISEPVTAASVSPLQRHQKRMRCFLRFFTPPQPIHH